MSGGTREISRRVLVAESKHFLQERNGASFRVQGGKTGASVVRDGMTSIHRKKRGRPGRATWAGPAKARGTPIPRDATKGGRP